MLPKPSSPNLNLVNISEIVLAVCLAAALGVILSLLIAMKRRTSANEAAIEQNSSDSALELLGILSLTALVITPNNQVLRATPGAIALGLVKNRELAQDELRALVQSASQTSSVETLEADVAVGLGADKTLLHARAVQLSDSNVLMVVEDNTESKRLDDTRRDFIANISHELKTPIGAISLLAEALVDASDDPDAVQKFSKSLRKESKRLTNLIKDVVQLSRIQSAEVVANAEVVDLSTVVMEALDRNSYRAEARNVKITYDAPEGLEVIGDPEMLTVAVKNLIENAILYSEEGAPVGVGLRKVENVAEIAVTDSGLGIPQEDQARIFERFYRVDPSRSRATGGTGLGLAIVKHVASTHNGEVKLFSKPGVGSTFTLRIPLADKNVIEQDSDRSQP
ncbi:MAG: two-component sensor histidine kinase [Actinobacteria bacterium]|uniref:histidine kinase n=2 Tax=freshwater metagenome TaxID=449393 RepID=A0A6J6HEM9_9ZZZZ|nr:two-component sensor histidine kinase [Actinomycetota bacterium]